MWSSSFVNSLPCDEYQQHHTSAITWYPAQAWPPHTKLHSYGQSEGSCRATADHVMFSYNNFCNFYNKLKKHLLALQVWPCCIRNLNPSLEYFVLSSGSCCVALALVTISFQALLISAAEHSASRRAEPSHSVRELKETMLGFSLRKKKSITYNHNADVSYWPHNPLANLCHLKFKLISRKDFPGGLLEPSYCSSCEDSLIQSKWWIHRCARF